MYLGDAVLGGLALVGPDQLGVDAQLLKIARARLLLEVSCLWSRWIVATWTRRTYRCSRYVVVTWTR